MSVFAKSCMLQAGGKHASGCEFAKFGKCPYTDKMTQREILKGKSGISPEMAIRLSKAFGSTPETWLRMQLSYDLAQARKDESKIKVRRQHIPEELHAQ
jgi:hypothetical protein